MRNGTKQRVAFDLYVRLGPTRSLDAVRKTIQADPSVVGGKRAPSLSTLERWSSALHWQDRIADLEREARLQDEQDQVDALRAMNQRHREQAVAMQERGLARITDIPVGEITAGEAVRALIEGMKLERLAHGLATDHVQKDATIDGRVDLSLLSVAELRSLAALGDRSTTRDIEAPAE